jgi:hypothetical protein
LLSHILTCLCVRRIVSSPPELSTIQSKWIGFVKETELQASQNGPTLLLQTIKPYIEADVRGYEPKNLDLVPKTKINLVTLIFIAAYEADLKSLYEIKDQQTILCHLIKQMLDTNEFSPIKYLFKEWRESYDFSIYKYSLPQISNFDEIEMFERDERTMDDWVANKYVPQEEELFSQSCLNWVSLIVKDAFLTDKDIRTKAYSEFVKFNMACILQRIIKKFEPNSEEIAVILKFYNNAASSLSE